MSTSHFSLKRKISKRNLLEPRTFLKLISGTVAACVLIFGFVLVIIAQPYQSSLDLRQQAATTGLDCNQNCTSSDQCAINLRCYNLGSESKCRLALNPSSSTCQVATAPISDDVETTKGGLDLIAPPVEPTTNSLPFPSLSLEDLPVVDSLTPTNDPTGTDSALLTPTVSDIEPSLPSDDDPNVTTSPPADDNQSSLIGNIRNWWLDLNSPEQSNSKRMLIVVVSVGLILIGLALIISSRGQGRPPTDSSTVASDLPADKAEVTSTANPPDSDLSSPPPSTLTTSATSASPTPPKHTNTNQPVPTAVSSAQLYPSGGMTSRLKQKGVTPPT